MERKARETLDPKFKFTKISKNSDSLTEKECFSCFFDLHLSGCICECNPTRCACLNHAQSLCSCEPSKKSVLFRYSLYELDVLVSALEGDATAVKKWAEIDNDNNNNHGDNDNNDNGNDNNNHNNNKSFDLNVKSETDKDIKSNNHEHDKSDIKSNNQGHNQSVNLNIKSEIMEKDIEPNSEGRSGKSSSMIFGVDLGQSSQSQNGQSQSLRYAVELVEIGTVMRGNSWSCKEAIFTKGFKSRVEFFSVVDPTKKCNYISEVLDAGVLGPLFKVKMEENPDIFFTQASPIKCWILVQERLNQEILKSKGQTGQTGQLVPPVAIYSDPIDGLEMFGFLSYHIIQILESQDANHQCINYWTAKELCAKDHGFFPERSKELCTRPPQNSSNLGQKLFGVDLVKKEEEKLYINSDSSPEEIKLDKKTLKNLFEKANIEELKVMYKVFSSGSGSQNWKSAFEVLSETLSDQLTN